MDYRRLWQPGGCYFFTVNLQQRQNNNLLLQHIDALRTAVRRTRKHYPFTIHGWVVLPDHLHCLLELPNNDSDFAKRWRLIKMLFSKHIPATEYRNPARQQRRERGIWQRRYWEHLIRNQQDFNAHLDYIHINPVKHGLVDYVKDWPYSTFHYCVAQGLYPENWAGGCEDALDYRD